jgi:hypothetical protein
MMYSRIDLLVTQLYPGKPCAQRYYLRHTLRFLAQHPQYLDGTATDLCKAMRGHFPSYYRKPVRWQHYYEALRQCDRHLTAEGITPGGTMELLRMLYARIG